MERNYKDRSFRFIEKCQVKHVFAVLFTLVALVVAINTMWQLHYDAITLSDDFAESSEYPEQLEMGSEYLAETYTMDATEIVNGTEYIIVENDGTECLVVENNATEIVVAENDVTVIDTDGIVSADDETDNNNTEEFSTENSENENSETDDTGTENSDADDNDNDTEDNDLETEETEEPGVIYEEQAGDVGVVVTASEGALPEEAELSVVIYEEGSAEYLAAVEAVGADLEEEGTGFLAMDISFLMDGVEVEPLEAVTVAIDISSLLDEDDDPESIEVQHLEETAGELTPVLVADASDEVDGDVDTDTAVAEFTVESFSTFTLQWNQKTSSEGGISVAYTVTCWFRDSDSGTYSSNSTLLPEGVSTVEVNGSSVTGLILSNNNTLVFDNDNELLATDGYTLDKAEIFYDKAWREITSIYAIFNTVNGSTGAVTFRVIAYNGDDTVYDRYIASDAGYIEPIRLYYTAVSESATATLSISDDIANSGRINAVYSDEVGSGYTYTWYYKASSDDAWTKSDDQENSYYNITNAYARYYFYVTLNDESGNIVATSPEYQVPYYGQIQNGSFESPVQTTTVMQYTNGLYADLVWHTTGLGSLNTEKATYGQDIEIVSSINSEAVSTYGWNPDDKNQYAELNCEQYGTLYQDVLTTAGAAMSWECAHTDRTQGILSTEYNDSDMMMVIITDSRYADKYLSNMKQISAFYEESIKASAAADIANATDSTQGFVGPYTVNDEVDLDSDGDTESVTVAVWVVWTGKDAAAWTQVADTYVVPDGQYVTRFMFAAVQTRSGDFTQGDLTLGNLIDDISFVQTAGEATLTIKKTVSGVSESTVIPAGSFAFTIEAVSGSYKTTYRVSLPSRDATITDTSAWQITLSGLTEGDTCTITESSSAIDGYTYLSSSNEVNTGTSSSGSSGSVTLSTADTIAYTNTYQPNITLYKTDGTTVSASDPTYTLLSGAEFTLLKTVKTDTLVAGSSTEYVMEYYYYSYDSTNGTYSWEAYTDGNTIPSFTLGELTLESLENSADITYTLTEITTPDGYNTLDPVTFTVESGEINLSPGTDEDLVFLDNSDGLTLYLTDSPGYVLPSTGGIGANVYQYAGILIIVCLLGVCVMMSLNCFFQKRKG